MSRSEYHDDGDNPWGLIMWRGAVASAVRGLRGQAFLREMAEALDSMQVRELLHGELQCAGGVCAVGRVAQARGIDWTDVEAYGNNDYLASEMGIAPALVREIEYVNDEFSFFERNLNSNEQRWHTVRDWVEKQITGEN